MLELASLGAGVMHSRSIEFGKKFGVPIHVRSSFTDNLGTMIVAEPESPDAPVSGAALVRNEALVTLRGLADRPGTSLAIFSRIAQRAVAVDMIVQNVGEHGKADISFTVTRDDLRTTLAAVQEAAAELGATDWTHLDSVSKVSVVGLGMARQTGVADRMFRSLAEANINIQMITTSGIKISVLVNREQADEAVRTVHRAFQLESPPTHARAADGSPTAPGAGNPLEVVDRLQGMEDLAISDITLDDAQARVTITGVPDHPGLAARVFEEISAAGVFVDLIVQSYAGGGLATLSFTVPHESLAQSIELASRLAEELKCGPVPSSARVAMLSVAGIGLRSHTGVAIRMFEALARANINVDMINTSEVLVTVVVDGTQGHNALAALKAAFTDVLKG